MSENPYRAPMGQVRTPAAGSSGGIWSDGNLLVVHKQATLPPFCVKTNEPASTDIQRTFYWHSALVYLLILLNILAYIIGALLTRKSHKLAVPLSNEAATKRRNGILIGWILSLLGIGIVVFGFYMLVNSRNQDATVAIGAASVFAGFVTLIVGAILGSRASNILVAKKITDHASWFKGADPDYVQRFPVIPPHPTH